MRIYSTPLLLLTCQPLAGSLRAPLPLAGSLRAPLPVLRPQVATSRAAPLMVSGVPVSRLPSWGSFLQQLLPAKPAARIRSAAASDAPELAQLCTNCFFGTHSLNDGPVIFAQRLQIYQRVLAQITRRLKLEDGRECLFLVAEDEQSGRISGCVDLAVHLFDRDRQLFELTIDEMPPIGPYAW